MKGQFAPQFDYAPDRGLLVRKFDKSAILTVASWSKDGGSALALGAVGTWRARARQRNHSSSSVIIIIGVYPLRHVPPR